MLSGCARFWRPPPWLMFWLQSSEHSIMPLDGRKCKGPLVGVNCTSFLANAWFSLYGAGAVDVVRLLADHLLLAHSRAAFMRPLSRVELAIAHRVSCSDFRLLTSHVSHNRTERALQLASQHVVAGAAVLVLPELFSSHVSQGAIVCG